MNENASMTLKRTRVQEALHERIMKLQERCAECYDIILPDRLSRSNVEIKKEEIEGDIVRKAILLNIIIFLFVSVFGDYVVARAWLGIYDATIPLNVISLLLITLSSLLLIVRLGKRRVNQYEKYIERERLDFLLNSKTNLEVQWKSNLIMDSIDEIAALIDYCQILSLIDGRGSSEGLPITSKKEDWKKEIGRLIRTDASKLIVLESSIDSLKNGLISLEKSESERNIKMIPIIDSVFRKNMKGFSKRQILMDRFTKEIREIVSMSQSLTNHEQKIEDQENVQPLPFVMENEDRAALELVNRMRQVRSIMSPVLSEVTTVNSILSKIEHAITLMENHRRGKGDIC